MSVDLPEDFSRWPSDPYALLGVALGVAPRELRRAYTHLIRIWKPEQHPEHFRRIRQAYEIILRQSKYLQLPPTSESDNQDESSIEPSSSLLESNEAKPFPLLKQHPLNEIEEDWQLASGGQESLAYRRLVELQRRNPEQLDIYPRLYWLLTLFPQVDPNQSPYDWLVAGLRYSGLTGPLRELYRRELVDRPQEILRDAGTELLRLPVRPALLADLCEWRWQAAGQLKSWQVIAADIDCLRDRFQDDEESWGRLLFAALDQLVWMPDGQARELVSKCHQEVTQLPPLNPQWTAALDRLEFLSVLSAAWRWKLDWRTLPQLNRLVPISWTHPFTEIRPLLLTLVQDVATNPLRALAQFDDISKSTSVILAYLGQLLKSLQDTLPPLDSDHLSSEEILRRLFLSRATLRKGAASRFARKASWFFQLETESGSSNYPRFREDVLAFCLSESIEPEQVADALHNKPKYWLAPNEDLSALLRDDWPLRYVYVAHQLFWTG